MLSISRFILLKERILKKDFANDILYFDNVKNAKYISAILFFVEEIKKNNCTYKLNRTTVKLEKSNEESKSLVEALWIFNKVRDSLAHGQYTIDLEKGLLKINNDHSNEINNPYKLNCSIPIQLLNYISVYIEKNNEKAANKNFFMAYRKYLDGRNFVEDIKDLSKYEYKINKELNFDNNNIDNTDSKIKIFLNKLKKEELRILVKLLLEYKTSSQKQKEQIRQVLAKLKFISNRSENKSEEPSVFELSATELICEISYILGIKVGTKNPDSVIALYTYMCLVLSQDNEIDYSHICLRNLIIDFDPYKKEEGKGITEEYGNRIKSINTLCNNFIENCGSKIEQYYNNPNQSFRLSLIQDYAEFYNSIMKAIGNRNKLILTSMRNSIEQGNYYVNKNGSLILYDQTNHNDNSSIKFLCSLHPQELFDITKKIELGNAKDNYVMDDFFKELETIVDNATLDKLKDTMNSYSNIIFGKDIDTEKSMEYMYQEAIATILNIGKISKK